MRQFLVCGRVSRVRRVQVAEVAQEPVPSGVGARGFGDHDVPDLAEVVQATDVPVLVAVSVEDRRLALVNREAFVASVVLPGEFIFQDHGAVTVQLDCFEIGRLEVLVQIAHLILGEDRCVPLGDAESKFLNLGLRVEEARVVAETTVEFPGTFAADLVQDVVRGGSPRARCGVLCVHNE